MNRTTRTITTTLAAAALTAGLAACGGSDSSGSSAAAPVSAAPTSATPAGGATTTTKVSANGASADELVAALKAGGVPNADRWAKEIQEYRPYDTSDPTLRALQSNLAKYNPGADTMAKILAVLQP
jgi:hypothetical protein